jgi:protein-S-isoprenylcysteine O-methyltransferase Ste14
MGDTFFRVAFVCLFCVLTGLRLYWKLRAGLLRERLYSREEHPGFVVFRSALGVPLLWGVLAYSFVPASFPWMYLALPPWLRLSGVVLGAGAIALLFAVHRALGPAFSTSPHPRQNHRLVESGPYRWTRHPMYSAYFTLFLSVFLISGSWLAGSTGLAIILMLMTRRRVREEKMLLERFGERYRRYRAATGMFLPRFSFFIRRESTSPARLAPPPGEIGAQSSDTATTSR